MPNKSNNEIKYKSNIIILINKSRNVYKVKLQEYNIIFYSVSYSRKPKIKHPKDKINIKAKEST